MNAAFWNLNLEILKVWCYCMLKKYYIIYHLWTGIIECKSCHTIKTLEQHIQSVTNQVCNVKKSPPTSFSLITSTNIGISSLKFLTFNFNLSATLVLNFKAIPSASPKLLNLNQKHPSKELLFLIKSFWNRGYDNFS